MHDEARVRMSDRTHHLLEQPEPCLHAEARVGAVPIERTSIDVLEDEERLAVGRDARVVHAGDVRSIERFIDEPAERCQRGGIHHATSIGEAPAMI